MATAAEDLHASASLAAAVTLALAFSHGRIEDVRSCSFQACAAVVEGYDGSAELGIGPLPSWGREEAQDTFLKRRE